MKNSRDLLGVFKNKRFRKLGLFCVVLSVAIVAVLFSLEKPTQIVVKDEAKAVVRPVTVMHLKSDSYSSLVTGYGDVSPEWQVSIRSKVQGDIIHLAEFFRVGERIGKGDLIAEIDPLQSEVLVAEAELMLKKAKVDLIIEEKESQEAFQSWKRSGIEGEPSSPLVLRKPFLEMAHANVVSAKASLDQAKQQLGFTKIKAPFDALILSREVSFGGELFPGDVVCTLAGTERSIIPIHVDKHQWSLFPADWVNLTVDIIDPEIGVRWNGKLIREGQHYDAESRLRTVYVEVENPLEMTPSLLPGNFVKVEISGREISGLLKIPESARNQKGLIWIVTEEQVLKSYNVVPVFQRDGFLFVKNPVMGEALVVVNPNNSFTNGLKVTPIIKNY